VTHTVKKGESVALIAKKYGVPAKELLSYNKIPHAKFLKPGTVLTIPEKAPKPAAQGAPKEPEEIKGKKGKKGEPYSADATTTVEKMEKGKRKYVKVVYDQAMYEKVKAEFVDYARKWLEKEQNLSQANKGHKEVTQDNGRYVASYSEILMDTMGTEVKQVEYEDTPYVGHITYTVRIHRSYGPTAQAAMAAGDEEVKEENMREIFSYDRKKNAWR
jgi:murein DD-endopeptidase MepM/ murein hydrolase activator NlpD